MEYLTRNWTMVLAVMLYQNGAYAEAFQRFETLTTIVGPELQLWVQTFSILHLCEKLETRVQSLIITLELVLRHF